MVSTLMVYPSASMNEKVEIRATGMAMDGISVARQSCRNSQVMSTTRASARIRVVTISSSVTSMNSVGS